MVKDKITQGEPLRFEAVGTTIEAGTVNLLGPASETLTTKASVDFAEDTAFSWRADVATGSFAPGAWSFEVWITRDGVPSVERRGSFTVEESLANMTAGADTRSAAEIIVYNIEEYLKGAASSPVRRYKINNRELERHSIRELTDLLKFYRRQLTKERRRRAGKRSGPRFTWNM